MDAEYPAFEPPLCSGLKQLCQRLQEAYRELKEDLAPFKDDRYYRLARLRVKGGLSPFSIPELLSRVASLRRTGLSSLLGSSLMFPFSMPAA
ncbi:transmembrane protein 181 [Sigmodon hispidus]